MWTVWLRLECVTRTVWRQVSKGTYQLEENIDFRLAPQLGTDGDAGYVDGLEQGGFSEPGDESSDEDVAQSEP
jgi:hypothetical protein